MPYTYVNDVLDDRYSRPLPDCDVLALSEADVPPQEIAVRRRMEAVGFFMATKDGFPIVDRLFGGSSAFRENEQRLNSALAELRAVVQSTPAHKAALRRAVAGVQESGKDAWKPLVELAREA